MLKPNLPPPLQNLGLLSPDYFEIIKYYLEKDEKKLDALIMADVQVTNVLKRLVAFATFSIVAYVTVLRFVQLLAR